jgi:hypothetical protein
MIKANFQMLSLTPKLKKHLTCKHTFSDMKNVFSITIMKL